MNSALQMFQDVFAPPRHLILLVLAMWAGLALAERRAERSGISKENLNNMVFVALITYLLAGRIAFVLEHLPSFLKSPLDIFSISPSVFDPLAAAAGGILASAGYAYRKRLGLWPTLDAVTPVLATMAVGLGLSHLAAESAYGAPTALPWGIEMRGSVRHPSQIYESLAAVATLGLIWFSRQEHAPGGAFLVFAAVSAAWRLFLEGFRGDSVFLAGGVRIAQIVALSAIVLCMVLFEVREAKIRT